LAVRARIYEVGQHLCPLAETFCRKPNKEYPVPKEEKAVMQRQPNAIQTYFRETVGELRKVKWPTRKEATNLTMVVLAVLVAMSIFLGTLDFLFTRLFALILG
jgi:preprotein translocase subunit SecE